MSGRKQEITDASTLQQLADYVLQATPINQQFQECLHFKSKSNNFLELKKLNLLPFIEIIETNGPGKVKVSFLMKAF